MDVPIAEFFAWNLFQVLFYNNAVKKSIFRFFTRMVISMKLHENFTNRAFHISFWSFIILCGVKI